MTEPPLPQTPLSETPLLEMRKVSKEYRGVAALKNIDFQLRRGEVHAIVGENGAGKSTLVKILSGVVAPSAGEIRLAGDRIQIAGPAFARRYGIAMVYQETSLVPTLTVAQNLYLGDEKFYNRLRGTYIEAQQFLQSLNFPVDPTATVQSLGTAKRQMVEIARAVRLNAKVIIFDEPTATLTPEEKHHLFTLIDRLGKEQVSIIFISHALEEALDISDRITVLRDGAHIVTADAKTFSRDKIDVLLRLDPASVAGNALAKDGDYPLAWAKKYGNGRVFYGSFSHGTELWDRRDIQLMYLEAIKWSLGLTEAEPVPHAIRGGAQPK